MWRHFYILHFNGTIDCVFWGPECAIFIVIFSILDYLKDNLSQNAFFMLSTYNEVLGI